jgi:hypothetical protein
VREPMKLYLSRGEVALVDADMYDYLSQWKWSCYVGVRGQKYAVRRISGTNKVIKLHHVVTDLAGIARNGKLSDHENGDSLDNRSCNLRTGSRTQNNTNRAKRRTAAGEYKGICKVKRTGRWKAEIKIGSTREHLGEWDSPEKAALAYDSAAIVYHGDFARVNFPNIGTPLTGEQLRAFAKAERWQRQRGQRCHPSL